MKTFLFPLLVTTVLLSACGGSESNDSDSLALLLTAQQPIEIPFTATAGSSTEVSCADGTFSPNGTDGHFTAFAFYAHDFRLVTSSGEEIPVNLADNDWQHQGVALLDFADRDNNCTGESKPTNRKVAGFVASTALTGQTIAGIRFRVGVPAELNHGDRATAPSPLNRLDMHWNWQNGYKFARLDFAPDGGIAGTASTTWNFHLGSTGCTPNPVEDSSTAVTCSAENRPAIDLLLGETALENAAIVLDYQALVANETLNADTGGKPGCMSFLPSGSPDTECYSTFDALGLDYAGTSQATPGQVVFKVIDTSL